MVQAAKAKRATPAKTKPKPRKAAPKKPVAAGAPPLEKPKHWVASNTAKVELTEDGSIGRADLEQLALLMADDVEPPAAWTSLGKQNAGSPGALRRNAQTNPVFIGRLAALRDERSTLEAADPVFGRVAWMAAQLWRSARAQNDIKAMMEAAKLSFDVAKQQRGVPSKDDAPPGGAEPVEPNPVGRPAERRPGIKRDPKNIRDQLAHMGMGNIPKPQVDEDDTDEPE